MGLGDRIKKIRLDRGENQKQFAKALGAVPSSISDWESGYVTPKEAALKKIADLAGITVTQLIQDFPGDEAWCYWHSMGSVGNFTYYETSCGEDFIPVPIDRPLTINFCPYCGARFELSKGELVDD